MSSTWGQLERDEKQKLEKGSVKELWTDNGSGEIPRRPDSSLQLWEKLVE